MSFLQAREPFWRFYREAVRRSSLAFMIKCFGRGKMGPPAPMVRRDEMQHDVLFISRQLFEFAFPAHIKQRTEFMPVLIAEISWLCPSARLRPRFVWMGVADSFLPK